MYHVEDFTNLFTSASDDFETTQWLWSLCGGRILIDLIAKDCRTEVEEGNDLRSECERSAVACAAVSSPSCSPCVVSGSLGEETGGMARDDEVVAVPMSMFPSVQVPPSGVSELVEAADFVTATAEGALLDWSGILSSPHPEPRPVPVFPHPPPDDSHPTGCASHCDDDACSPQAESSFHPSDVLVLLWAAVPQPEPPAPASPHPLLPDVVLPRWCEDAPRALDVAEEVEPKPFMKSSQTTEELPRS